ncbi:tetratricopeptide repeat protein [Burkholderia sp. A1]|uniref:tetratricopeptide repeat protein n=1 Tax=Burkholderia sp. A1 TaxID=148446 RepID=UPI0012683AEA|nr:tetratricopeptide repeat protein [Burkholderia sp. A1]
MKHNNSEENHKIDIEAIMSYRVVTVFAISLLSGCAQPQNSNVHDRATISSPSATQSEVERVENRQTTASTVPSVGEVESKINQGNYADAIVMMRQVIEVHPDNARAHYILSQLLEREGLALAALGEIEKSKSLAPVETFTTLDAFSRTENRIKRSAQTAYGNRNMPHYIK